MGVRYRCLVVDDEPLARRVIARHIAELPWLHLSAECSGARDAAAYMNEHEVDVMFLDVKMPGLSGLEFLETLRRHPQVILTTAHSEYALAGYDHSVTDFLLKPISFDRFLKAVNKLTPPGGRPAHNTNPAAEKDFIFMRADRVDHRVPFRKIRYLEAYGNYVKVHLDGGIILAARTMTAMERTLPPDLFLRVHRSFMVSLRRIDQIAAGFLRIDGAQIPIGRSYRREVAVIIKKTGRPGFHGS